MTLGKDNMKILFLGLFAIGQNQKEQLARIVSETSVKIVLSSTWRLFPDNFAVISAVLEEIGAELVGITPDFFNGPRRDEIAAWMGIADKVIQDDSF